MSDVFMLAVAALFAASSWLLIVVCDALMGDNHERKRSNWLGVVGGIVGLPEIRIADNGPGLPAGSEASIFDKFFRGATVAPDGRRGVGLGLAICRAIVEAHVGRIAAANRRQGGAEFVITLTQTETPPRIVPEMDAVSATA